MKWLCVFLALVGCAGASVSHTSRDAASPALAYLETLPDMRGRALPSRADAPRTVVMFFASWWGHCRTQLGQLRRVMSEPAAAGVRVVLINAYEDYDDRGSKADMRALLARLEIPWPVVDGTPRLRAVFGDISKVPAIFVYDASGRELVAFRRTERPAPTVEELRDYLSPQ